MNLTHHQHHEATSDALEASSIALQPPSDEANTRHKLLYRVEQDGKALLLVSFAVGLALWLTSIVTWLFTPPDPETDY
jgi:hypothetical protein